MNSLKKKLLTGLPDDEIVTLVKEYLDDVFVEPNKILLKPKGSCNALYVVFLGKVNKMENTQNTCQNLKLILQQE